MDRIHRWGPDTTQLDPLENLSGFVPAFRRFSFGFWVPEQALISAPLFLVTCQNLSRSWRVNLDLALHPEKQGSPAWQADRYRFSVLVEEEESNISDDTRRHIALAAKRDNMQWQLLNPASYAHAVIADRIRHAGQIFRDAAVLCLMPKVMPVDGDQLAHPAREQFQGLEDYNLL